MMSCPSRTYPAEGSHVDDVHPFPANNLSGLALEPGLDNIRKVAGNSLEGELEHQSPLHPILGHDEHTGRPHADASIPQMLLEVLPGRVVGSRNLILNREDVGDTSEFEAGSDRLSPVPELVDHLGRFCLGQGLVDVIGVHGMLLLDG